ncbi:MAG: MmcQ/YjbR family DNA-binding protein [Clostridia bacterium]|nr:MmcQ/YjbR family DNA-binding protein [Clostridia bacterium]
MNRKDFEAFVTRTYNVPAEHPFSGDSITTVFRHIDNKKWFAIVMTIDKSKLMPDKSGKIDVVNIKCAPEIIDTFWEEDGIFPAYHMNKTHWLTLSLDGSVDNETIKSLLAMSHRLTSAKAKKK